MPRFRCKEEYVDAMQLSADATFTVEGQEVKAEKGDWLVTIGTEQKVVKSDVFFKLYAPADPNSTPNKPVELSSTDYNKEHPESEPWKNWNKE